MHCAACRSLGQRHPQPSAAVTHSLKEVALDRPSGPVVSASAAGTRLPSDSHRDAT